MLPLRDIVFVAIAVASLGFLVGWWFSRLPDERPDTLINKLRDIRTLVWFWLAAALGSLYSVSGCSIRRVQQ